MANIEYKDLSVFKAIKKIENKEIIIPDIQREYCWSPEDIVQLFESIVLNFPIGSFIFWETEGKNLNSCTSDFYAFLDEAKRKKYSYYKAENHLLSKNFVENKIYSVVLDGQQRLTSFYLIFKGIYYVKKPGKGYDENPNNFLHKDLYYNLDCFNEIQNSKDVPQKFIFLTDDDANNGNYFRVKDLIKYQDDNFSFNQFIARLMNDGVSESCCREISLLYFRLGNESKNESLIHYFMVNNDQYDAALDVFVRVNSSGVKLNKTDLLFSTLINKWPKDDKNKDGRRKEIEKFLDQINYNYDFGYDKDFLLRTCIVLANDGKSGLSMQDIAREDTVKKIQQNWSKIKSSIIKSSEALRDINLNDERILSYNAIIPITYYIYIGGKFPKRNGFLAREELKKYFAIAFVKGIFGQSGDSAITMVCNAIRNNKGNSFSMDFFKNVELSGQRNFNVDITLINRWLETYNKGSKTYLLLMLLSPNLDILGENYDQDHSHADALFTHKYLEKVGVSDEKKRELFISKRNHLPNLSFMKASWNRSKSKTDLETWIIENQDKACFIKLLPLNTSYKLKNFEHFYVLRRSMMKYVLTSIFGVQKENISLGDEVTLNTSVFNGQFGTTADLQAGMHGHVREIEMINNQVIAAVEFEDDENKIITKQNIPLTFLYIVEPLDKDLEIN